jgi:hypothetical protein
MTPPSDNTILGSLITLVATGYIGFRTFNYLLIKKFFSGTVTRMHKIQNHNDFVRNLVRQKGLPNSQDNLNSQLRMIYSDKGACNGWHSPLVGQQILIRGYS